MKKFINGVYKNQALIYKIFLFVIVLGIIVYMFPKGSQFKYEIIKGQPWQYETLYAPFDFAIRKTEKEIKKEQKRVEEEHSPYFDYEEGIVEEARQNLNDEINKIFSDSVMNVDGLRLVKFSKNTLRAIYQTGVVRPNDRFNDSKIVFLKRGNEAKEIVYKNLVKTSNFDEFLDKRIKSARLEKYQSDLHNLFSEVIRPNVVLDKSLTDKDLKAQLEGIAHTKGVVSQGTRIISKGEIIDDAKLQVLKSLQHEYQSNVWNASNYYVIIIGYMLLVGMVLLMLLLFINKYSASIFRNNKEVTFVFFNILLVVALTIGVLKMDPDYIYAVPICILPVALKAFFQRRLSFFTHIMTVLLLGFIVPNSYEYMFLQIMAGIVTILGFSKLYRRANIFISVGKVTLVYIIAYYSFTIIHEGSFVGINGFTILTFIISGMLLLFVQPLIYAYEKIFGFVSDMSLLELSNTNSNLMKELANKAPGTFHHSLNVANLAEAAANEIGANSMLVRVGALHHDIGKMINPIYFTENQTTSVNPHDDLPPEKSAKIIINHVVYGIEMAKNHGLPDRIIDFIRTHHGNTLVYYFYKKALDEAESRGETIDKEDFQYPGPRPFSKETAILMMSDSVEAASKSLKEPTAEKINNFVEKIVDFQMKQGQFLNADITLREIQIVKKILKRKLSSIYHLRIEYPE